MPKNVILAETLHRATLQSLQCSPDSLAGFQGPPCRGMGQGDERRKGKGGEEVGNLHTPVCVTMLHN